MTKRSPKLPRQLILKDTIGSGAYKSCWTIKGTTKYVALTQSSSYHREGGRSDLTRELKELKRLAKAGLPVLMGEIKRATIPPEPSEPSPARKVWALVTPKFDFSWYDGDVRPPEMKVGHLRSLVKIYRALDKKKLCVNDLQFLGRGREEMVISDPLGIGRDSERIYLESISETKKQIVKLEKRKRK